MTEGEVNKYIYIVAHGEFRGLKQVVRKDSKAHSNGVRQFLSGNAVSGSLRSVFNGKIGSLTNKSHLTQQHKHVIKEEVITFGEGQIFGEERNLIID